MRDFIKRLAGRIYVSLGGDLIDLSRRASQLLTSEATEPSLASPEERLAWLGKMVTLDTSKELEWLMADISAEQKTLSFEEARNEKSLEWGRATLNGLMLLRDRLRAYHNEFDDVTKKAEAFDKHAPL